MKTNTELLTVLCVMSVHKIVLLLIFAATAVQEVYRPKGDVNGLVKSHLVVP